MPEAILDVLSNPHFESYVASPLMGLVFGAILFRFGHSPRDENRNESPDDVRQERRKPEANGTPPAEVHHHHHYPSPRQPTQDDGAFMLLCGLLLLLGVFLLVAFLPQVARALSVFNITIVVFCLTTIVLMLSSGRFNTPAWWLAVSFPAALSIGCLWLTLVAQRAVVPDVVAYADSLLAAEPLSLSLVVRSAITFVKAMNEQYIQWLLFIGLSFFFIAIGSAIALLQCLHDVSLSNLRGGEEHGWQGLARRTARFGTRRGRISALVFLALGWLFGTGTAYQLLHQWTRAV